MYPAAVDGNFEGRRQKPDEPPIDPVVEDITRLRGMIQAGMIASSATAGSSIMSGEAIARNFNNEINKDVANFVAALSLT